MAKKKLLNKVFKSKEEIDLSKVPFPATVTQVEGGYKIVEDKSIPSPNQEGGQGDSSMKRDLEEAETLSKNDSDNADLVDVNSNRDATNFAGYAVTNHVKLLKEQGSDVSKYSTNEGKSALGNATFNDFTSFKRVKLITDMHALQAQRQVDDILQPEGISTYNSQDKDNIHSTYPITLDEHGNVVRAHNGIQVARTAVLDSNIGGKQYKINTNSVTGEFEVEDNSKNYYSYILDGAALSQSGITTELREAKLVKRAIPLTFSGSLSAKRFSRNLAKFYSGLGKAAIQNGEMAFNVFRKYDNLGRAFLANLINDGNLLYVMYWSILSALKNEAIVAQENATLSYGYARLLRVPAKPRTVMLDTLNVIGDLLKILPHDKAIENIFKTPVKYIKTHHSIRAVVDETYALVLPELQNDRLDYHPIRTSLATKTYYLPSHSVTSKLLSELKMLKYFVSKKNMDITVSPTYITEFMSVFIHNILSTDIINYVTKFKSMVTPLLVDLKAHGVFTDSDFVYMETSEPNKNEPLVQTSITEYITSLSGSSNRYSTVHQDVQDTKWTSYITIASGNDQTVVTSKAVDYLVVKDKSNQFTGQVSVFSIPVFDFLLGDKVVDKYCEGFRQFTSSDTSQTYKDKIYMLNPINLYSISAYDPRRVSGAVNGDIEMRFGVDRWEYNRDSVPKIWTSTFGERTNLYTTKVVETVHEDHYISEAVLEALE